MKVGRPSARGSHYRTLHRRILASSLPGGGCIRNRQRCQVYRRCRRAGFNARPREPRARGSAPVLYPQAGSLSAVADLPGIIVAGGLVSFGCSAGAGHQVSADRVCSRPESRCDECSLDPSQSPSRWAWTCAALARTAIFARVAGRRHEAGTTSHLGFYDVPHAFNPSEVVHSNRGRGTTGAGACRVTIIRWYPTGQLSASLLRRDDLPDHVVGRVVPCWRLIHRDRGGGAHVHISQARSSSIS